MDDALIETENLSVTLGGTRILDSVSLSVRPGEIVTVIGPNGSGKTTLLKALMGLVPSSGKIIRRQGLKIGYVPQSFHRDPSLPIRVMDFLRLFAPRAAAEAALERVKIFELREKQINALSGGELSRVLLARAIAREAELLLLDEPTASVDVAGEAEFYRLIDEIRGQMGCGILLVSHDLHVVMARSDRVLCLNHHICCQGTASAVVQNPAFRALFGEEAGELALYSHHHRYTHTLSGDWVEKHKAGEDG